MTRGQIARLVDLMATPFVWILAILLVFPLSPIALFIILFVNLPCAAYYYVKDGEENVNPFHYNMIVMERIVETYYKCRRKII